MNFVLKKVKSKTSAANLALQEQLDVNFGDSDEPFQALIV